MDELLEVISTVSRHPREGLSPELRMRELGLSSSLSLSILRNAIENRLHKTLPVVGIDTTVGEIFELLDKPTAPSDNSAPTPAKPRPIRGRARSPEDPLDVIGIGIDIEMVESLPEASDYHAHEFYSSHFSAREIDQAMSRPRVREHLCGLFCAKEALKKSDDHLLDLRMSEIEVTHQDSGRRRIETTRSHLNDAYRFRLTISHTSQFATAVVLSLRL